MNTRGGARKGAGRKKIKDKKKPFIIYVRDSSIRHKNIKKLKEKLTALIEK